MIPNVTDRGFVMEKHASSGAQSQVRTVGQPQQEPADVGDPSFDLDERPQSPPASRLRS